MALTDRPLCTFRSDAIALEHLLVASWQGEDVLSRPYRFEAVLATTNPLFDEDAMLGQTACLTLFDTLGIGHPYHGIVTQVEQLDSDDLYHYCRVVLEPRMTRLRLQRFSEIWLDKNLPELLRDVLKHASLAAEGPGGDGAAAYDFDLRLHDDDVARTQANFTCQYEETSFDFFSRLLEYYGCYYFFEQQADHEALVICNDRGFQPTTPLPVLYRPLDSALDVERQAVVRSFTRHATVQPAQVVLQDFSASNAQLTLRAAASVAASSVAPEAEAPQASAVFSGHYGVYGEHFGSNDEGQWLAGLRAQALGCRHRLFHGLGRATGLRSGSPLQLIGHPRLPLNGGYHVLEARHSGHQPLPGASDDSLQPEADTRFVVIPGDVQFRPALDTPKPNARGVITAIVDGDDDGKPLLNEYGCYKVSFPFIRGEKKATRGSAWLRMVSLSTGSDHGMHFPLLKGSEVLVAFLGGDPDRPIITGSVPNSENPNKVDASNVTQSGFATPGGHYLAMEDHPSGPLLKMGAPAGNTSFTLGNGLVQGAHLKTDAAMHLTSNTLNHSVGSAYSFKVEPMDGGDDPSASGSDDQTDNRLSQLETDDENQKKTNERQENTNDDQAEINKEQEKKNKEFNSLLPTEELVNKKWDKRLIGDIQWKANQARKKAAEDRDAADKATDADASLTPAEKDAQHKSHQDAYDEKIKKIDEDEKRKLRAVNDANLGVKVGWNNSRTVSVELNTSVEQAEATLGILKQELNVRGWTVETNISGPKTEFTLHPGTREFKTGLTSQWATKLDKALSKKEEHVVVDATTVTNFQQSGTYFNKAEASLTLTCGPNKIELTPAGIILKSASIITIDAGVNIKGNLSVNGKSVFGLSCEINQSLKVASSLQAFDIKTMSLSAARGNLAAPIQMELFTGEITVKPIAEAAEVAQVAASEASQAASNAALAASEQAQNQMAVAANEQAVV